MKRFEGMSIEQVLQSCPILQTADISELLRGSSWTLARWQNSDLYENPMPSPFSVSCGAGNNYDASKLRTWYQTWPLRKRTDT